MQKNKSAVRNLLIRLGFVLFGVFLAILFGYGFVLFDEAGGFGGGNWKLLDSSIKFKHIADATTEKIWAITEDEKYYCFGPPDCGVWVETEKVSVNAHEEYDQTIIIKDTCTPNGIFPSDPKGKVVECALSNVYFGIEIQSIVYYALLEDGALWVWRSSGPWYVGLGMFITLISPFVGIALGLLMYTSFRKYQDNKSVTRNYL